MTRFVNTLLVFLMVLSAAAVYDMKYEAEISAEALASLERNIENEKAELSLLKAEWSVLTQPARLEEVVQRHQEILQLQPLTADQVGTLADIPEKPVVVEPEMIGPSDGVGEIAPQRSAQAAPESIDTSDDPGMVR